jgi:Mg2+/Co2+ transporter CorC
VQVGTVVKAVLPVRVEREEMVALVAPAGQEAMLVALIRTAAQFQLPLLREEVEAIRGALVYRDLLVIRVQVVNPELGQRIAMGTKLRMEISWEAAL